MRKITTILVALFASVILSSARQLDSAKRVLLDEKLSEYVAAIEMAGTEAQKEECDFLIGSSTDSLVRQHIALRLYDHYMSSKVMGAEAVAIHIFDTWFLTRKVSMGDDIDLMNARVYADFNRQSQIGCKAPELTMESIDGEVVTLFRPGESVRNGDRHSVLFFYDTSCAKCKVESVLLSHLLEDENYPVNFYAIYTGDNRQAWEAYVTERFDFPASRTKVVHLWDPTLDSDFQRKYGILQTPRMFLIRPDKVIKGRGLDTYALAVMLNEILARPDLDYGDPQTEQFFDQVVSMSGVREAADALAQSQLHAGDTTMCRQLLGDFLYYLAPKTGQDVKEGTKYLIDEYILGRNDIWKSADDSLKVIGFAEIMDELLSKSASGTEIAGVKVPGELLAKGKAKDKTMNLRKIRGSENVLVFHTTGCHICAAEIAAAHELTAGRNSKVRVFLVNVDDVLASDPALASKLFDLFDLSTLPYIITTDKKGIIQSRYATLQK